MAVLTGLLHYFIAVDFVEYIENLSQTTNNCMQMQFYN